VFPVRPVCQPSGGRILSGAPGAKVTSFDVAKVDSTLGMHFLADQGNNGIQVLNTRGRDWQYGAFNQPSYLATLFARDCRYCTTTGSMLSCPFVLREYGCRCDRSENASGSAKNFSP
jgi:hypothetical protein